MNHKVIEVGTIDPYPVRIGPGTSDLLAAELDDRIDQVMVVHQEATTAIATTIANQITASGRRVQLQSIPDGERAKNITVAAGLWGQLGRAAFSRTDAIVAIGGGACTDLAGFVAATWLRGVPVYHVATTVLAMVDAAIGGKTAIDTAEGKNLVGAFYPPKAVFCDTKLLDSLPAAETISGLAEVAKCGFIADEHILELLETNPASSTQLDGPVFTELVARAVQVKADVVGQDLTEQGVREILNYGHTLGHAIEWCENYRWRHGAGISIGMVFAAELSYRVLGLSRTAVNRHRHIFSALGLPITYRSDRWTQLITGMRRDKKTRAGELRLVLLRDIGQPEVVASVPMADLEAAYRAITS